MFIHSMKTGQQPSILNVESAISVENFVTNLSHCVELSFTDFTFTFLFYNLFVVFPSLIMYLWKFFFSFAGILVLNLPLLFRIKNFKRPPFVPPNDLLFRPQDLLLYTSIPIINDPTAMKWGGFASGIGEGYFNVLMALPQLSFWLTICTLREPGNGKK